MQACFFAGTCKACQKESLFLEPSDLEDIASLAKVHIEKSYAVVGLSEHLESSFLLLEAYLPRHFSGLLHFYRTSGHFGNTAESESEMKRMESNDEKIKLLQNNDLMALDVDLYEFVLQKFQLQLRNLIEK